MNPWEIARLSRSIVLEGDKAGEIRRPFMPNLELTDYEMEIFWEYSEKLSRLGVQLDNEYLIDALNARPGGMEDAILAFFQYESRHRFKSGFHPTNFLAKAIVEGWKPNE